MNFCHPDCLSGRLFAPGLQGLPDWLCIQSVTCIFFLTRVPVPGSGVQILPCSPDQISVTNFCLVDYPTTVFSSPWLQGLPDKLSLPISVVQTPWHCNCLLCSCRAYLTAFFQSVTRLFFLIRVTVSENGMDIMPGWPDQICLMNLCIPDFLTALLSTPSFPSLPDQICFTNICRPEMRAHFLPESDTVLGMTGPKFWYHSILSLLYAAL